MSTLEIVHVVVGWLCIIPILNIWALIAAFKSSMLDLKLIAGLAVVFTVLCVVTHVNMVISSLFGLLNVLACSIVLLGSSKKLPG